MKYNFDEQIDRSNTNSVMEDLKGEIFGSTDLQAMWVADMNFRTPDCIVNAMKKRMEHEIFGYTFRGKSFTDSIESWLERRHNCTIDKTRISFSPGVVSAVTVAIQTFTEPGDKVIVQPPVYFPFFESIKGTGREMLENPLKLEGNRYYFDFNQLKSMIDDKTKMLILCSPHNPGGMVWKKEELTELATICRDNDILVLSDEIHADLTFKGQVHTPFVKIAEEVACKCIMCMAPSKTFNVAGLSTSFLVIPDKRMHVQFEKAMNTLHISGGNILGSIALETAFNEGEEWLDELMKYVESNFTFIKNFINSKLSKIELIESESTFLAWLDLRAYGMNDKELQEFFVQKAKLGINTGGMFGTGGDGFARINIGCTRADLEKALIKLETALNTL